MTGKPPRPGDSKRAFRFSPEPTDVELLAKYFRGLGDPTRLRILALVAEQERSVSELAEAAGVSQSMISNHLPVLRRYGFVTTERRGKRVFCRLSEPRVTEVIGRTRALLERSVES